MEEKFKPGWKIHPGETVKELFETRKESLTKFCHQEQVSYFYMLALMTCCKSITPKVAKALSHYFDDISEKFWLNLQRIYDEED